MGRLRIACLCIVLTLPHSEAQPAAVRDALAAMQHGDFSSAERVLRAEAAAHPDDAMALSLLGVALDNLKQLPEAAAFHKRAVALAPRSAEALNNYGVHEWMAGNPEEARKLFLRAVAIDPAHRNANLQLARLALMRGEPRESLRFLDHLPAGTQESPQVLLLRLEALYRDGDRARGDELSARLLEKAKSDIGLSFAAATALSQARQYDKAEMFCEAALRSHPANFDVLYDLGIMATYAGHFSRAKEVLETALHQQPRNVDVLYALARADEALKGWEAAAALLAEAGKIDPERADVQELLAVTTSELGAFDDAVAAWDRVLQLDPKNEAAQRERSYTSAQMGELQKGIAGLEAFLARHPNDAVAHYELGQAERTVDEAKALLHFDKALEIDPTYVPAWKARGSLYYQEGKPEAAVKDLETAAARRPDDAACLDHLGQAYQALDRAADAARVLRRAAELAPNDSKTLLHLARALADTGKTEESKAVLERFRQLGPDHTRNLPAGLVEYLNLSEEQRHADYRARVEKAVRERPDDAEVRLRWLKLLVEAGDRTRAKEDARALAALDPGAATLAEAGRVLVDAKLYDAARETLEKAAAASASPAIRMDLAVALLRGGDQGQAFRLMEQIPESAREGDYYLTLAEMLAAAGKTGESQTAFDRAIAAAPPRGDFYLRAMALVAQSGKWSDALRILDGGARVVPASREIQLCRAVTLEMVHRGEEADRQLGEMQSRWPEWYPAWVARGMVLQAHGRGEEARKAMETATALGAPADVLKLELRSVLDGALFR